MRQRILFIPLLLLIAMGAICSDDDLVTISQNLNRVATSLKTVQDVAMEAFFMGAATKPEADFFVKITMDVAAATQLANDRTRAFSELPLEGRDGIIEILIPVIESIEAGLEPGKLATITNEGLKSKIRFGLETALGVLNATQTLLGDN